MYIILQYFYSLLMSLFGFFSVHIFTCAKGTSHFSCSLFYSGCVLVLIWRCVCVSCWGTNSNGGESDFRSSLISQCFSFVVSGAWWPLLFVLSLFWWLNLSGLRCPESGLLLRHCAFWQSLCCKSLSKHQRSRVMISVNTHEEGE